MKASISRPGQLVALAGRLDTTDCWCAREALHAALAAGRGDLVVDVSGIELVDRAGLGVLLLVHRRAHARGRRMVLRGVQPQVARSLAHTRLDRIFATESAVPATAA